MGPRKIIHLDLDAFFCAVEELHQPELRGKAFAVGGKPQERGVVASCSYAARQQGVHSAMPMAQAIRQCTGLLVISPNFEAYRSMSKLVMEILHQRAGLVEQLSIDEAFLDVTDLPQSGLEIAQELQQSIRNQLGLPCSLGVASNKLLAKTATDVGKGRHRAPTPPCAIEVVPPGEEAAFLASLPARALWGVGPKTAARLTDLGIKTIGDIARLPEAVLLRQFGQMGRDIGRHARGIDDRPVIPERAARSISSETTFERDIAAHTVLRETLYKLSEDVARSLRRKGLCAGTIRLKIRWPDFTTHTRQISLSQPTDQDRLIFEAAYHLFNSIWKEGQSVRLMGVGAARLVERAHQLSLWDTTDQKELRLRDALDELQQRFGADVVQKGRSLKNKPRPPGKATKPEEDADG
jgi:DNA polymerase IV